VVEPLDVGKLAEELQKGRMTFSQMVGKYGVPQDGGAFVPLEILGAAALVIRDARATVPALVEQLDLQLSVLRHLERCSTCATNLSTLEETGCEYGKVLFRRWETSVKQNLQPCIDAFYGNKPTDLGIKETDDGEQRPGS